MDSLERSAPGRGTAAPPHGPFVGPRPFQQDDGIFFFGRSREAVDLANMVAACALTVVYGPSGSGKSSLINARLSGSLEEIESDWVVITFSSWQSGFETLLVDRVAAALAQPSLLPACDAAAAPPAVTFPDLAASLQAFARNEDRPVALVLDQFEEYFLYNEPGGQFETVLARLANRRSGPVHLVLCLRSDRLFLLDRLRTYVPEVLQNLFCVEPLGAEGARDAVLMPVERYNEITGQGIGVEPELVEAVVQGASEREIFKRLPLHGRGDLGGAGAKVCAASSASPVRIVAPFLQMALESIWRHDVGEHGRSCLTLQTLRDLAGASADTAKEALVGRLVQRHFDSVLSQRTLEEQDVCAKLFDRMVTYSGTKVAIAFPDDLSALPARQVELAETLLTWLAAPGSGRFVRLVASEEPGSARPDGTVKRYEIVHDALAVPILDWVVRRREQAAMAEAAADAAEREAGERQRREMAEALQAAERASREAAELKAAQERSRRGIWQAGSVLVILTVLLAAAYGYLSTEYRARQADVHRFLDFAAKDDAPEFRTRLLLAVAALNRTSGVWRAAFESERKQARETIKTVLLRSPRYGGEYVAAASDPTGTRLALLSGEGEPDRGLQTLALDTGETEATPLPANFLVTRALSRDPKLAQVPIPVVGFLDGLSTPALVKGGLLYFRPERAPQTEWRHIDLADLLPPRFLDLPGFCTLEITAGAVQVTCYGNSLSDLNVVRLRPSSPPGPDVFEPADRASAISLNRPGTRFAPAFSPLLAAEPRDRWAMLFRSDETNSATEGQYQQRGITVGAFGTDRTDNAVWDELTDRSAGWVQKAIDSNGASAVPSVAFSDDGSSAVLRVERKIFIAPLAATDARLVAEDPRTTPFQAPDGLAGGVAQGMWNNRPLLAAVHRGPDQPDAQWRFSWLFPNGLVVLESRRNDEMLQVRQPWSPAHGEPGARLMFTGVAAASRLNFSRDGRFLTLTSPEWLKKMVKIRAWDMNETAVTDVAGPDEDARLIQLACDRARMDSGDNSFDAGEKITWVGAAGTQPCGAR